MIDGVDGVVDRVVEIDACGSLARDQTVVGHDETFGEGPDGDAVVVFEHKLGWMLGGTEEVDRLADHAEATQELDVAEEGSAFLLVTH